MSLVLVITYERQTAHEYVDQLRYLFDSYLTILPYSLEDNSTLNVEADVVIASTHSIYNMARKYAKNCPNIIFADLTFKKETLIDLYNISQGTKAMLVNSTQDMAVQTIDLIYSAGIDNIELLPVYPGISDLPECALAITPGEANLVPAGVKRVIDLGHRVLSARTIINLAAKTKLASLLHTPKFEAYFQNLVQNDFGLGKLMEQMSEQEKQLDLIMQIFNGGVLTVASDGVVTIVNKAAEKLLGRNAGHLVGQQLKSVLKDLGSVDIAGMGEAIEDRIINVNEQLMAASVYPVSREGLGGLVLIKSLSVLEKEQQKIRQQIISKGHVARYTFDDIVGKSHNIVSLKKSATRIARSSSSVLIYGQSGVGKELFAQSIHNASPRCAYPFIAINCASIPQQLLESELFGYSEGAFTGAKKGGKAGYFELAHMGTLFLDEVGEMSLSLQSQLLRVLQEKAVIRVGGDSVINIDVRIIAASNKKLHDLVSQKLFREDLYYRLNVLSLIIPPLKRHCDDIPLLIDMFKEKMGAYFEIEAKAMALIKSSSWNGNVRELGNFVERLACLGKKLITLEDASSQIDEAPVRNEINTDESPLINTFIEQERPRLHRHRNVLEILDESKRERKKIGRGLISEKLRGRGVFLSPQEVRTIVKIQQTYGLVNVMPGRAGTEISHLGQQIIHLLPT